VPISKWKDDNIGHPMRISVVLCIFLLFLSSYLANCPSILHFTMPTLSLFRGQSIVILLSLFLRLSLGQIFAGFTTHESSPPLVYVQATVQTTQYSSYSSSSHGSSSESARDMRSSDLLIQSTGQTPAFTPNGISTTSTYAATNVEASTAMTTAISPVAASAASTNLTPSNSAPTFATAINAGYSSSSQSSSVSAQTAFTVQVVASLSSTAVSASSIVPSTSISLPATTATLPAAIGSFELVGCVGSSNSYEGFQLSDNSNMMSVDRCVSDCRSFSYAGIFNT
jgi:hypothetical protein